MLLNEFTNTVFLGHSGDDAVLAAVGLGNMMQNCFGLSIGFGFAAALDTLVSQAYGAGQHKLCCHFMQRARVIAALQLVWMLPLMWFSDDVLLFMHQDPNVAADAARYNRAACPGLALNIQFQIVRNFLSNRGCPMPAAVISGVTSVLHVAWAAFFIMHLRLGNAGAGYANLVTWSLQLALISCYLAWNAKAMGFTKRELLWVQSPGFKAWGDFMKTAVPATLTLSSEWWFWELCAVVVGWLGSTPLAAHISCMTFVGVAFMPAIGMSSSASTLVGNNLGANCPRNAALSAKVSIVSNGFVWTSIVAAVWLSGDAIPKLMTNDVAVQQSMLELMHIYLLAGFTDTTQNVMGGCLRGAGYLRLATAVYLISFYLVMLPIACLFTWALRMGVDGVWWSFLVGTSIADVVFICTLIRTDWAALAVEASKRMQEQGAQALNLDNEDSVGAMSMQNVCVESVLAVHEQERASGA